MKHSAVAMSYRAYLILPVLLSFTSRPVFSVLLPFVFFLSFFPVLSLPFLALVSVFKPERPVLVPAGMTHGDPQAADVRVRFPVRPAHGFVHYFAVLPPGARFWRGRRPAGSIILQAK